ncbi:fatty-acyl-CoA synthase [Caulobacter sp. BE264]|uniref:long-chain-fatty-acid--CoA ligase n=1 Tax=Caulobacter sp. BE264 TaxID=2817724 RepID=UPI002866B884|nr:long-chain-fatty-acid--CoA ligase [Caulobacter sp. BE264]MDR7230988.1 fatty-acyl-CoA synthase [Caulobacter sp. BE264]
MQGLMQHGALTLDKIIDHAAMWHGGREVVSRSVEGPIVRTTYGAIRERAKRVSNALLGMGIKPGDRVGTLAWNTGRHMEAWYGIMGIGAVCHTLNPRLFPEQIAWIADHAGDRAIFTDLTFLPIIAAILPRLPHVEHVVVFTDRAHMPADFAPTGEAPHFKGLLCYEELVEQHHADCAWGGFDEGTAAGLCYTSGTTGDPKGVMYSHRSNFLHTLITLQPDVMGLSQKDVILPVVPMFHANAWGVAFSAPGSGAKIVMPGAKMDGASIFELLDTEGVTFSAAVPTVWQMLLQHLEATGAKLPNLKKVVIGGAACPESIIRAFHDKYDVEVVHAWGMTETSPVGTLSVLTDDLAKLPYDQQMAWRLKQGRPPLGVEICLKDDEDKRLPHDGKAFGHLKIRGPIIAAEYFRGAGGKILDDEGFFDTGDVATIDEHGFMQITDRAKDVVKSGGEWISTIEIENIAVGHPKVALAAVVGQPHPKWDERPVLLVKLKDGETATPQEFIDYLQGKIAKWWMPDDVLIVDDIPLGATGKIDKKLIRKRLADDGYTLPATPLQPSPPAPKPTLAAADGSQATKIYAPEPVKEADQQEETQPAGEPLAASEAPSPQTPPEAKLIAVEPEVEAKAPEASPPEAKPLSAADAIIAEAAAIAAAGPKPADPVTVVEAKAPEAKPEPEAPLRLHEPDKADAPKSPPQAKPVSAEATPFAVPITPGRKAKAKAKGEKSKPGWASTYLDFAVLVALTPAILAGGGALGVKLGLIDLPFGYNMMTLDWAPRAAQASVATGLIGLVIALFAGFGRLWKAALLALLITGATFGVMFGAKALFGQAPPIHDVATDWKTPLGFSDAALAARGGAAALVDADPSLPVGSAAFAGRRIAEINAETCPAARPLVSSRTPADAYEAAKAAVLASGMTLITDDPMDGRLEATARSFWYGLTDDVVVRVRPDAAGSRLDMRSIGRDAGPDLGRNCDRIGALLTAIKGG